MKQQEEVVLSDLPIFGIISTKGQSFHTVEALSIIMKTALNICGRFFVCYIEGNFFSEYVVLFGCQRNALYLNQMPI